MGDDLWFGWFGLWGTGMLPHGTGVTLFTDASLLDGRLSWSVCVCNPWLRDSFTTVPSEAVLTKAVLRDASFVSSPLHADEGSTVFDAELIAIARALLATRATRHLTIFSDCLSALQAIDSYAAEHRPRARLRMAGNPILAIILRARQRRTALGATTTLSWVEAHSASQSLAHVGNRIADFAAKLATAPSALPSLARLPLEMGSAVVMRNPDGHLLLGDPRRLCRRLSWALCSSEWQCSNTQDLFSSPVDTDPHALWLHAVAHHPNYTGFVLRMLGDVLQWYRDGDKITSRQCSVPTCGAAIYDTAHLSWCPRARRERAGATEAVLDLLTPFPHLAARCLPLRSSGDLKAALIHFRFLHPASSDRASLSFMVGAFRRSSFLTSLRALGIPTADHITLLGAFRSVMLRWIRRAWDHTADAFEPPAAPSPS